MVVPTLATGGMEMMVASLSRTLVGRGHEVGVTCLQEDGPVGEAIRADGIRVSVVPTPGVATNFRAPALAAHFARIAPNVVHSHSGVWAKAAHAARLAGVKRVGYTSHGWLDRERWFEPPLYRLASRSTDWVAAVSADLASYLEKTIKVDGRKLRVLPNGIDTERFKPGGYTGALRMRLGLGSRPLVGIIARLVPVKDHAFLLRAFERVREMVPDVALAIVGDGPLRAELEAQAAPMDGAVRFLGETRDAPAVYRDLDVFVLSSKAEGTSMSVLEAMASGVPVVATAVGGTPALLDGGACGSLAAYGDEDALAAALICALQDVERTREMAVLARSRVLSHYSEQSMVDHYEVLYGAARPARRGTPTSRDLTLCVE
jgi:glycosyltransferase involved in cell wall biosynthesis